MRVKGWILSFGAAASVVVLVTGLITLTASEADPDAALTTAPRPATPRAPEFDGAVRQLPVVADSVDVAPTSLLESTRVCPPERGATRGAHVAGTVVREADGTALPGARVVPLSGLDEARGGEAVLAAGVETDANGTFVFPPEVAGDGLAGFFVRWHCRDSGGFDAQQRIPLTAELGPLDALSLRLDTGWILMVRIRDEGGRPVSGAYVRSRDEHGKSDSDVAESFPWPEEPQFPALPSRDYVPTTDSGDFALRDLRWLEQALPVVVFAEGFETRRLRVPTPARGTWSTTVDVLLMAAAPGSH